MSDEIEFDGHTFKETRLNKKATPEERAEAVERFHDFPAPERCPVCWNTITYCMCVNQPREIGAIEKSMRNHPSSPSVAGVSPEDRERLLAAYAARGADEIEAFLNSTSE